MGKLVKDSCTFIGWIVVGAARLDGDRDGMSHDLTQKMTQLGKWLNSKYDSTQKITLLGKLLYSENYLIWRDLKGLSWVKSVNFAWLENELDFFLHFCPGQNGIRKTGKFLFPVSALTRKSWVRTLTWINEFLTHSTPSWRDHINSWTSAAETLIRAMLLLV